LVGGTADALGHFVHPLLFNLKHAHHRSLQFLRAQFRQFRPEGLTPARFDFLFAIYQHEKRECLMSEIHLALGCVWSNITRYVDVGERLGWVTTEWDGFAIVSLTEKGIGLVELALKMIKPYVDDHVARCVQPDTQHEEPPRPGGGSAKRNPTKRQRGDEGNSTKLDAAAQSINQGDVANLNTQTGDEAKPKTTAHPTNEGDAAEINAPAQRGEDLSELSATAQPSDEGDAARLHTATQSSDEAKLNALAHPSNEGDSAEINAPAQRGEDLSELSATAQPGEDNSANLNIAAPPDDGAKLDTTASRNKGASTQANAAPHLRGEEDPAKLHTTAQRTDESDSARLNTIPRPSVGSAANITASDAYALDGSEDGLWEDPSNDVNDDAAHKLEGELPTQEEEDIARDIPPHTNEDFVDRIEHPFLFETAHHDRAPTKEFTERSNRVIEYIRGEVGEKIQSRLFERTLNRVRAVFWDMHMLNIYKDSYTKHVNDCCYIGWFKGRNEIICPEVVRMIPRRSYRYR
jgi:DNA-binding MarR family transcriptional regulator